MSEEKPVPKTKEELIAMLKEQLDKVEVCFLLFRMTLIPCKTLLKMRDKKGKS